MVRVLFCVCCSSYGFFCMVPSSLKVLASKLVCVCMCVFFSFRFSFLYSCCVFQAKANNGGLFTVTSLVCSHTQKSAHIVIQYDSVIYSNNSHDEHYAMLFIRFQLDVLNHFHGQSTERIELNVILNYVGICF